jgi:hypothetical protein
MKTIKLYLTDLTNPGKIHVITHIGMDLPHKEAAG